MYITHTYTNMYIEILIPIIYKEILQNNKKKLANPMENEQDLEYALHKGSIQMANKNRKRC